MKKIELIDPPVAPFSSKEDIKAWLKELKAGEKPWSEMRKDAIEEAEEMLADKR